MFIGLKGAPGYKVGRTWRIAKKDLVWLRCSKFVM